MQNLIHEHHKISRVLITGTGKGAAVAAIFTLRNAKEILSWTRSISPELVIENLQDNTPNIDLRCITFGCPNFIKCSDIALVDSEISSRIIHMYGEHQLVPLSLTALTSTFGRVGLSVNIKDSKSTFPGRFVKRSSS